MRDEMTTGTPPGSWTNAPPKRRPGPPRLDDASAERALLGRMILAPSTIPTVAARLAEDDLSDPGHQLVWRTLTAAQQAGRLPDDGEVLAWLAGRLAGQREVRANLDRLALSRLTAAGDAVGAGGLDRAVEHVLLAARRRRWTGAGSAVTAVGEIADPGRALAAAEAAAARVNALVAELLTAQLHADGER